MAPEITYKIQADVNFKQEFHGAIVPIPTVLIYFLNHNELRVFSLILEQTLTKGECNLKITQMGKIIKIHAAAVSAALSSLRYLGLLLETPNGSQGSGRIRKINYKNLQRLNDLIDGEDPGIYSRIRKATRKRTLTSLTKEDIKAAYDNRIVNPEDDPAESEEYD